jgi:hypothetical protein
MSWEPRCLDKTPFNAIAHVTGRNNLHNTLSFYVMSRLSRCNFMKWKEKLQIVKLGKEKRQINEKNTT